jgi:putative heme-binding domain-containing protein
MKRWMTAQRWLWKRRLWNGPRAWAVPLLWPVPLVWGVLLGPRAYAQNPPTLYPQADVAYGARIYTAQCTTCHGVTGDVVPGVDFRAGRFKRITSDVDLRTTITTGVPGTAMPPFNFDPAELAGIVAYLRNMRDYDARGMTLGDPARGQALFDGAGNCRSCHRLNGKGPRLAPDLSDIGSIRTVDYLQRTLLDPQGALLPQNRSVRTVTRDGRVIQGRRLNEDTYTVQIIDEQENLVSLPKAGLREYSVSKTSAMPSYKDKFSSQDVSDMVAYLLSLRGAK